MRAANAMLNSRVYSVLHTGWCITLDHRTALHSVPLMLYTKLHYKNTLKACLWRMLLWISRETLWKNGPWLFNDNILLFIFLCVPVLYNSCFNLFFFLFWHVHAATRFSFCSFGPQYKKSIRYKCSPKWSISILFPQLIYQDLFNC